MTTTVYQTDKRSGITYAYHSISYWDKDKELDAIASQMGLLDDLKEGFPQHER